MRQCVRGRMGCRCPWLQQAAAALGHKVSREGLKNKEGERVA